MKPNKSDFQRPFLSTREASVLLGIHRDSVTRLIRQGKLFAIRRVNFQHETRRGVLGGYMIPRAHLLELRKAGA